MKDFADFKAYCNTLDIQKIEDDIRAELNDYADRNDIPEDDIIWKQTAHSHKLMMKFLEEYHNWLHR